MRNTHCYAREVITFYKLHLFLFEVFWRRKNVLFLILCLCSLILDEKHLDLKFSNRGLQCDNLPNSVRSCYIF